MDGSVNGAYTPADAANPKKVQVANEADFLEGMRKRAEIAVAGWSEIHERAAQEIRFYSGQQWPQDVVNERKEDGRPMLTINQLPKFANQVVGDALQNKIQLKISAVNGDGGKLYGNQAGMADYTASKVMDGVVRNIQLQSKAERGYDTVLRHAVISGLGFLRVIKQWKQPYGFEQELRIRAVRNQFAVLFDPSVMFDDEPDFAGAHYCFVQTEMRRDVAEKKYPGATFSEIGLESTPTTTQWWAREDKVRICEYLYREVKKETYVQLSDGAIVTLETLKAKQEEFTARGLSVIGEGEGQKSCVYTSLVSSQNILEGPYLWDGGYIPIVPVFGPELLVDGKMQYWNLFRHSHDAQRMYNYWRTAATEAVALAPKAPFIVAAQTIAGRETEWKDANRKPRGALVYTHLDNVPPPQRAGAANSGAAEINQSLQANDDVKSTIGLFDASLGQKSNEVSGKAIMARQREGDVATFVYHDNLAKAIEHIGRILVDIVPKVYDTKRLLRIVGPEETEDFVAVNMSDLGMMEWDVAVSTGPSYTTRRVEAAEMMVEFVKSAPDLASLVIDLVFKYMDWPGADKIAERLKRTIPPNLLSARELEERVVEEQARPQMPPTPQEEHQMQVENLTAEADFIDAQAKRIAAEAKLAQAQALSPDEIAQKIATGIAETIQELSRRPNRGTAGRAQPSRE